MSIFKLKHFSLNNDRSALKIGTDSILLGSVVPIPQGCTRIYDVGTGTGIVAMMLAQRTAGCGVAVVGCDVCAPGEEAVGLGTGEAGEEAVGPQIVGIEIDGPSYEEAAGNFAAGLWASRMSAVEGDFRDFAFGSAAAAGVASMGSSAQAGCNAAPLPVDNHAAPLPVDQSTLVISNPPYYEEDTVSPLAAKARAKSTSAGLSYRDIFDKFAALDSASRPHIALILPFSCKSQLFFYARSHGFFPCKCVNIRTLVHKPFTRIVASFSPCRDAVLVEEDLTLFVSGSEKTPEYSEYTKDFQ